MFKFMAFVVLVLLVFGMLVLIVSVTLRVLLWFPIQARIHFKICLLTYRVHTN